MEPIDFSALHGNLIEDDEGNIQQMDEPYYRAKEVAAGVWQVLSDGDYTYVLEGDEELLCIDGGSGAGNIHTANNYLFDVTYMSEKCYPHRCEPFGEYTALAYPDDYPVVFLKDGDIFNLKGRELEVFNIEEHCSGSLQFLDRKSRILFCGDE